VSGADQTQTAARRALRALLLLQGHTFEGVRLKQIAEALGCSASTTLRTLEVLQDEGLIERIPGRDEYWRLSPKVVQIALAHQEELLRLRARLDETAQRYSRTPS
jgi:DNA-binding IclR family transcriptional regulator